MRHLREEPVINAAENVSKDILRPDAMLAAARAGTGLHDFGDMRWFEPASRWLDAVIAEAPLSQNGIVALQQSVLSPMMSRLRITDLVTRHPEVLDEDVSDPVVVVGMPRTGTTKLQRMLASDPAVQKLPFFQILNPVSLPGEQAGESHLRMELAQTMCAQIREHSPDFFAGHPIGATEPEEEAFAIEFDTQFSVTRTQVPSYFTWWMARPRTERAHIYDYLRTLLQCVQWQDGGRRDRPFVLKSTIHLGDLPRLVEAFPKATIINTHRDIDTTVASSARIVELLTGLYTDEIDLPAIGDTALELYASNAVQNVADRASLGTRLHVIDVQYDDVRAECLGVIRDIWASRGRTLSDAELTKIGDWDEKNPQHQFGRHTYSLERYGLTSQRVAEAFSTYLETFAGNASTRAGKSV